MPERIQSQYWGNARSNDIEDKKTVFIGTELTKQIELAQRLSDENMKFSARNFDLGVSSLSVSSSDLEKLNKIIREAVTENTNDFDLQNNIFGNIPYSDIEKKKIMTIGVDTAESIHINELMNENKIAYSAKENALYQTISITVEEADYDKVKDIIIEANKLEQDSEKANINEQPKFSKINVAADMRAEIGKALLDNGIDFSSSIDNDTNMASFNIKIEDMQKLNDILEQLQSQKAEKNEIENNVEPPVSDTDRKINNEIKNETESAETKKNQANSLSDIINSLNSLSDRIKDSIDDGISIEHLVEPINKAAKVLNEIESGNLKAEKITNTRPLSDIPLDLGEKISPILAGLVNANEHSINVLVGKNDTLRNKIAKNQSKIQRLNERVDNLEHTNSMLSALQKAVPAVHGIAEKIISINESKIKKITENKIPARQSKIEKHNKKLSKNENKLSKKMNKLKVLGAINKLLTGFKDMSTEEKRHEFASVISMTAQTSLAKAQSDLNKAVGKLNAISEKAVSVNGVTVSGVLEQNKTISKLTDKIIKSKNRIARASELMNNLEKIEKGEFVRDEKEVEAMIENSQKSISDNLSNIEISDNANINSITDNIIDGVVEVTNDTVSNAIEWSASQSMKQTEHVNVREERPVNPEPVITETREQKIMNEIASATGFTVSQLNALPKDIKADIIAEYEFNGGQINSTDFSKDLASILNIEPPKRDETPKPTANVEEKKEKDNPSKTVEELIENNANSIDGIINNTDNRSFDNNNSNEKKSRFSVKDLDNPKYAPRSRRQEQEQEHKPNKSHGQEI